MTKFWNWVQNQESNEPELRIDGDIGESFWGWLFDLDEVSPKKFREELSQYQGKNITVWINSNGGDVVAASQIYTALKEHKGKVTVKIDGTAISAASVIAMAGDEILMSPTAVMMIHNPWSGMNGEAKDFRHMADTLDEIKATIVNAYQLKSGLSRDEISQLMDDETWMGARKAIDKGFANAMLYDEDTSPEVMNGMVAGARMVFNSLMLNKPEKRHVSEAPTIAENKIEDPERDDHVNELEQARNELSIANNLLTTVRNSLKVNSNDQIVNALSTMQTNAELGQTYKTKVVDEACGAGVRAMGDAFNVDAFKMSLSHLPVSEVEKIRDSYESQAKMNLGGGGRHTNQPEHSLPDNIKNKNGGGSPDDSVDEKLSEQTEAARKMLNRYAPKNVKGGE